MKTKFGSIIVAGSGKIGGHVASKNRGGSYLRTKVTPANARTTFQSGVRALFTLLSQAWRGLLDAQRIAWNAATPDYAKTDIFGDLRNPSGLNLFQKLNNNLQSIGVAILDDPPAPASVDACVITSIGNSLTVPSFQLIFAPAISENIKVKVFATAPMSAGKSFVKSEYRLIEVLDDTNVSPYSLIAAYEAKFGNRGEAGQKIFVKLLPINVVTGQAGASSVASNITTE
jgi:hypothetical protein